MSNNTVSMTCNRCGKSILHVPVDLSFDYLFDWLEDHECIPYDDGEEEE